MNARQTQTKVNCSKTNTTEILTMTFHSDGYSQTLGMCNCTGKNKPGNNFMKKEKCDCDEIIKNFMV